MNGSTSSIHAINFGGISALITVFFILMLLFGAFKGFRRGLIRQSIRTGTIVLTVIICFIILAGFVSSVDDAFIGNTLGGVLEEYGGGDLLEAIEDESAREALANADATTVRNLLLVVLTSLFFPFIFTGIAHRPNG